MKEKQYKLIKKYPGSPVVGTVISPSTGWGITCSYARNCPEFWEEVVEDPSVYHIGESIDQGPYYIFQDKESYCKRKGFTYFYCEKDCKKWAEEQVKPPIFTTEDGVDIYKGDIYYGLRIAKIDFLKLEIYPFSGNFFSGKDSSFKYFSTKEAAEEYILLNKPCLSINDIRPLLTYCNNNYTNIDLLIKKLKELVKSK